LQADCTSRGQSYWPNKQRENSSSPSRGWVTQRDFLYKLLGCPACMGEGCPSASLGKITHLTILEKW
jgi:hypothetical protein